MQADSRHSCLIQIHEDIDARVDAIRAAHSGWPCRMGCDGCCHRLADMPRLTAAEWECLRIGLEQLPQTELDAVSKAVTQLIGQDSRPVVCPLLDLPSGACRVYAHRPVACRTYGYYVQRDLGLYCKDIEEKEAAGTLVGVLWGNQDPIELRLRQLGEVRELTEWFRLHFGGGKGENVALINLANKERQAAKSAGE